MENNKMTTQLEKLNKETLLDVHHILCRTVDYVLFTNKNEDIIKPFKVKPESKSDTITYTSDIVASLLSRQFRQEFKL